MTNQVAVLFDEINQLRAQYVSEVGSGGRKAWPRSIKDRIFELSTLGIKPKVICKNTQIPTDTIHAWNYQRRSSSRFKELTVVNQKIPKPVTVTVPTNDQKIRAEKKVVTVTVTTPEGYRIEGLDSESAVLVLIKMRGQNAF